MQYGTSFKKMPGYDQVNNRIQSDINDSVNALVRKSKRMTGTKIPKEQIIEAAVVRFLEHISEMQDKDAGWEEIRIFVNSIIENRSASDDG